MTTQKAYPSQIEAADNRIEFQYILMSSTNDNMGLSMMLGIHTLLT